MNKNGEKTKLLAVIAVFVMVLCAMAAVMPAADAAEGKLTVEVSGDGYVYIDNLTNDAIGNIDLSIEETSENNYLITGVLNYVGDAKSITTPANEAQTVFQKDGATADYGVIYKISNINGFLNYTDSAGNWQSKDKTAADATSEMMKYISTETGTSTYYITSAETTKETFDASEATAFTVSWDVTFANNNLGDGMSVTLPTGMAMTSSVAGTTTTINAFGSYEAAVNEEFTTAFGAQAAGYAYMTINGITYNADYKIVQTNSALALYAPLDDGTIVDETVSKNAAGEWVKNGPVKTANTVSNYSFLIPKDGNVVIDIVSSDKTVATYVITFGDIDASYVETNPSTSDSINTAMQNGTQAVVNIESGDFPEDAQVTDAGLVINTTGQDNTVSGTVAVGTYDNEGNFTAQANVELKDFKGTIVISQGSVEISNADIQGGEVIITEADEDYDGVVIIKSDVVVAAGATATITVPNGADVRFEDGVKILGNLTIKDATGTETTTVSIPRSATVTVGDKDNTGATLTFEGVETSIKGTVSGTGKIVAGADSVVTIDGTVTTDVSKVGTGVLVNNSSTAGTITLSDGAIVDNRTSVNGSISQEIVVSGEVTVVSGGVIEVNGLLTIQEGAVLILEQGSKLIINESGNVVNDGTISVEADAENALGPVFTYLGSSMAINGTLNLEGKDAFATSNTAGTVSGDNITVSGDMNVGEDATAGIEGLTVAAGGELNVNGKIGGEFTNNGTVTIDSEVTPLSAVTVNMGDGAVLNLVNAAGTYTVADDEMSFKYNNKTPTILNKTKVEFVDVAGVTVTDSLTTKMEEDKSTADPDDTIRNGYGSMTVSGTADVASDLNRTELATASITVKTVGTVNLSTLNVAEGTEFNLAEGVVLSVEANAKLAVAGTMDATAEDDVAASATNGTNDGTVSGAGTVVVTGTLTVKNEIAETTNVIAAHYESGTGNAKVCIYTTLSAAIAAGADDIELLGAYVIDEDVTIPANVKVDADTADNVVTIDEGVTVTVAYDGSNSGKIVNKSTVIDVDGTLVVEHLKKSGMVEKNIDSDVATKNGDSARYTSIYNALDEAVSGDVVTITRTDGVIDIKKDITIDAGVKLVVPGAPAGLNLMPGVTVTVNGTLECEGIYSYDASNNTLEADEQAETVVNGMFMLQGETTYLQTLIDGAYYYYDGFNCISPLSVLETVIADVESDVSIYGTVTDGDVTLKAEDITVYVMQNAVLTVTSLTLDGVTFDFSKDARVNATVSVADGTFAIANAYGGKIYAVTTIENDVETTTATMSGKIVADEKIDALGETKNPAASLTVSGTADIVNSDAVEVPMTVAENAVVGVSNVTTISDVTVNGTLNVEGTAKVTITKMTVSGTVAVAEKASAEASTMYIGASVSKKVLTDLGSGAVSGVKVGTVAYVTPNATFTATEDQAKTLFSTEYYVEDALFVTAYAVSNTSTPIDDIKAVAENAYCAGWVNSKDAHATDADGSSNDAANVGATDWTRVDADIEYNIYVINLRADQNAISSISVDGNLMEFGMINTEVDGKQSWVYGYTITVAAGSHTIQYQLANGYSGEGVLTVNGTQASGLTFTTEGNPTGTDKTVTYNLQLTGFEKSGYVPDSPDTGDSGESDSGMTITDYLLIVLVVLIIVMAIIVAMRLMRS